MRTIFLILALGAVGCGKSSGYDRDASQRFRAAWEKRRAGDEAGYRAALAEVAKKRGTWAGDRAATDLELMDEPRVSGWGSIIRQASDYLRAQTMKSQLVPPSPTLPGVQ